MANLFSSFDIDAKHTLELPKQNATPDQEIIDTADHEDRIIISKDSDFLDNYILQGQPKKLLIVSTGNINNNDLIRLFERNIETIKSLFEDTAVVEIDEEEILVHY